MEKIQVYLVDDHDFYRKSLRKFISKQNHMEVIREADNGKEFLESLNDVVPDVILMDVKMPQVDGITATQKALEINSTLKIIGLTFFKEREYCQLLIEAGAKGVIFKNSSIDEIIKAIEVVNDNHFYFSDELEEVF